MNRFKRARTELNKNGRETVNEVARSVGVSHSMISELEDDGPRYDKDKKLKKPRGISYLTVAKLAEHYGVPTDYLCGLVDEPNEIDRANTLRTWLGISGPAANNLAEMFLPQTLGNSSIDRLSAFNRLFGDDSAGYVLLQWLALCMRFADDRFDLECRNRGRRRVSSPLDDIIVQSGWQHYRNSLVYQVKEFAGEIAATLIDEAEKAFDVKQAEKRRENDIKDLEDHIAELKAHIEEEQHNGQE